jgi:ribosomal protein S18 acetylase RimI-like enzyme
MIELLAKKPVSCFSFEIDEFVEVLCNSQENDLCDIHSRIEKALLLVFARDGKKLVGVSAIKQSDWAYVDYLSKTIHSPLPLLEFGWDYVLPDYRRKGICDRLMRMAINNRYNVFATTKVTNSGMMHLLNKEFEPCGITYESSRGNYYLHTFIRRGAMWLRAANIHEWVSGNPNCWRKEAALDTRRD